MARQRLDVPWVAPFGHGLKPFWPREEEVLVSAATVRTRLAPMSVVRGASFRPLEAEPLSTVESSIVNGWQLNCQQLATQLSTVDNSILNG